MNRREFSRVDARLPIEVRVVPDEEKEKIGSRVFGFTYMEEPEPLGEMEDSVIGEWLRYINRKLDTILNLLTVRNEDLNNIPFRDVNIGGGGLRFTSEEAYQEGQILELKMIIPLIPPLVLYVYGEVVRSEVKEGKRETAVKFIAMDEVVREEIIRYVFRKQREILREKRERGEVGK
ncbi:MAG: PilZ domain-containing protein [Deltaproteobacteria bacterium]|nr:MAG: PilZ domain-containing protein [Deltaproteobacteria bacterium]